MGSLGSAFLPSPFGVRSAKRCHFQDLLQRVRVSGHHNLPITSLRLETLEQLRREAPSAFATAAITAQGRVIAHLYHRMTYQRLTHLMQR